MERAAWRQAYRRVVGRDAGAYHGSTSLFTAPEWTGRTEAGASQRRSGMFALQIEHAVKDFDTWKAVFDRDPADRAGSGSADGSARPARVFRGNAGAAAPGAPLLGSFAFLR